MRPKAVTGRANAAVGVGLHGGQSPSVRYTRIWISIIHTYCSKQCTTRTPDCNVGGGKKIRKFASVAIGFIISYYEKLCAKHLLHYYVEQIYSDRIVWCFRRFPTFTVYFCHSLKKFFLCSFFLTLTIIIVITVVKHSFVPQTRAL